MQPKAVTGISPLKASIAAQDLTFNISGFTSVSVLGFGIDKDGNKTPATLSGTSYSSSDNTVFSVAPDPNVSGGAIITFIADGTATLTETATAIEVDGTTTEQVTGTVTITLTSTAAGVTVGISFSFGTPV